ncbi:hypothetical protein [Actinomadura madurae]|uniref:hypothetical protein n=1 Tax=Actinomadura madurae TaxID=1993 RepID=UPI0020D210C0|nr:hypothetical protein [Actinomadura madurae]MCP9951545.1 hypothetical protein [Actinomadura madurae]MCP9968318.1 hypothetical protein [Actinomadura madurae]MCP9980782.1 hypothetical protein [Actinomadura madurae]MCQ0007719.1 hypothetical protein [Actinomadura madurae]MCQ0016977.1 hypothetical protein [Actinomadura madurae]
MIPAFAVRLCDDAAVFPPGLAPLAEAVPAHRDHLSAPHAELVGPLVVPAAALDELYPLLGGEPLDVSVTAPSGPCQAAKAMGAAADLPVTVRGLEVAVPPGMGPDEFFRVLGRVEPPVYVEIPRDERRPAFIAAAAARGHRAKFRTGGVKAHLYPSPDELAAGIAAVVDAGVPFKATAGLHHPVRNTDPETGFHQHGFLNLLLATDAALAGRPVAELAAVLADRDAPSVASRVAGLGATRTAAVRAAFLSFGTCGITDPLSELADLGLLASAALQETCR